MTAPYVLTGMVRNSKRVNTPVCHKFKVAGESGLFGLLSYRGFGSTSMAHSPTWSSKGADAQKKTNESYPTSPHILLLPISKSARKCQQRHHLSTMDSFALVDLSKWKSSPEHFNLEVELLPFDENDPNRLHCGPKVVQVGARHAHILSETVPRCTPG
eukprot:TRINITY_DN14336_c0_g1_i1.p1 TRINITY_DN14336_c0_g1~~TRINITY_DN14336_c0_g1_i1.p1  ORF type:complete len:158 (+),score=16.78 TRINITY_DN14336_c0_g1_i1:90-563(+)